MATSGRVRVERVVSPRGIPNLVVRVQRPDDDLIISERDIPDFVKALAAELKHVVIPIETLVDQSDEQHDQSIPIIADMLALGEYDKAIATYVEFHWRRVVARLRTLGDERPPPDGWFKALSDDERRALMRLYCHHCGKRRLLVLRTSSEHGYCLCDGALAADQDHPF